MFDVHVPPSESHRTCHVVVAAELDIRGSAGANDADLALSVEAVEHVSQEVRGLLARVCLTFKRVRDMVVPDSTSVTTAGIIEVVAPKDDGEDPLDVVVR
jgi:hypothetical protein